MKLQKIKQALGAVTAAALAVSGVALAVQCYGIYKAGEFTAAAVSKAFGPIAWPVYITLALCVAVGVLSLIGREPAAKPKPLRQQGLILQRAQAKTQWESCPESIKAQALAQQKRRKVLTGVKYGVLALCALVFLAYALDGSHFSNTDINGSMVRAMVVALPCLLVALAAALVCDRLFVASQEAEIALLKQAPKAQAEAPSPAPEKNYSRLRYCALGAAIALLLFGYFTGGTVDVLTKAVNICTECVGLG